MSTAVDAGTGFGPAAGASASVERIEGYVVPVDPMDDLLCESCQ